MPFHSLSMYYLFIHKPGIMNYRQLTMIYSAKDIQYRCTHLYMLWRQWGGKRMSALRYQPRTPGDAWHLTNSEPIRDQQPRRDTWRVSIEPISDPGQGIKRAPIEFFGALHRHAIECTSSPLLYRTTSTQSRPEGTAEE